MRIESFQALANAAKKHGFHDQHERLTQQLADFTDKLFVMIVGEGKMGKSTLINSLIGKKIADVSVIPKTWKVDIYQKTQNNEEEHALLYFKSAPLKPEKLSITAAKTRIAAEESKKQQGKESDLFQVRFVTHWPNTLLPDHIALVDTPGYRQDRGDNKVKINLYGAQGIEIDAEDPFQYFYHRSEIVLWCIRGNKIHDKDTKQFLQDVSYQKKPILGILTWMDQIPESRWPEIKQEAENIYKDQISNFIFTALGQNESLQILTLANLNKQLLLTLQQSGEKGLLKQQSYLTEQETLVEQLTPILEIYHVNSKTFVWLNKQLDKDAELLTENISRKIINFFDATESTARGKLTYLWEQANGDTETFQQLVREKCFDFYEIKNFIHGEINNSERQLSHNTNTVLMQAQWRTLHLTGQANTQKNVTLKMQYPAFHCQYNDNFKFSLSGDEGHGTGLLAGGAGAIIGASLLGPIGLAGAALYGMAKKWAKKRESLEAAKESIDNFCNGQKNNLLTAIVNGIRRYHQESVEALKHAFMKHHGRHFVEIIQYAKDADQTLLDIDYDKGTQPLPASLFNTNKAYPFGLFTFNFLSFDAELSSKWDNEFNKLFNKLIQSWQQLQEQQITTWVKNQEILIDKMLFNELNFIYPHLNEIKRDYSTNFPDKRWLDYSKKAKDAEGNLLLTVFIKSYQQAQESLLEKIEKNISVLKQRSEKQLDKANNEEINRLQAEIDQSIRTCLESINKNKSLFLCKEVVLDPENWLKTFKDNYSKIDTDLLKYLSQRHKTSLESLKKQASQRYQELEVCHQQCQLAGEVLQHRQWLINEITKEYKKLLKQNEPDIDQSKKRFTQQLPSGLKDHQMLISKLFQHLNLSENTINQLQEKAIAIIDDLAKTPPCVQKLAQ